MTNEVQAGAHDNPRVDHETSDVNIRAILGFIAGLIGSAVVIHFVIWLFFVYLERREATRIPAQYPLAVGQGDQQPPGPTLQANPRQDLRDLRAQEEAALKSYGWIDKGTGVVRIPIEEAMRLTVERGLPVRQEVK
jgi:hypothetical protein